MYVMYGSGSVLTPLIYTAWLMMCDGMRIAMIRASPEKACWASGNMAFASRRNSARTPQNC
eukprot:869624-Pyramimonas_sp.AAC.1